MPDMLDELVANSVNFGYLASREPRLAYDGASAEALVYDFPDASTTRSRRFAETMAKRVLDIFGLTLPKPKPSFFDNIAAMRKSGVVPQNILKAFDDVRAHGNEATHDFVENAFKSLVTLEKCFILARWFHGTTTGDTSEPFFVMPRLTSRLRSASSDDHPAVNSLLELWTVHERRWEAKDAHMFSTLNDYIARQAGLLQQHKSELDARFEVLERQEEDRAISDREFARERFADNFTNARQAAEAADVVAQAMAKILIEVRKSQSSGSHHFTMVVGGDGSRNFAIGNIHGGTFLNGTTESENAERR